MRALGINLRRFTIKFRMRLLMIVVIIGFVISATGGLVLMNRSSGRALFLKIGAFKDAIEHAALLKADLNATRLSLVTMLHEKDEDKIRKLQATMAGLAEDIDRSFDDTAQHVDDEELRTAMNDAKITWTEFMKTQKDELLPAFASGNRTKALELASGVQRMRYERFIEQVGNAVDTMRLKIADLEKAALKAAKLSIMVLAASSLLLLIMSIAIILVITRSMLKPLAEAVRYADTVASGNLAVALHDEEGKDEISTLTSAIQHMVGSFTTTLSSIQKASNDVMSAVDVLRGQTEKTSDGARNQSGQASQIAATAEEMSQTITDIARNASEAAETAAVTMKTAEEGRSIAGGAVETVDKVYSTTIELSAMVEKLNKGALEIGDIVTLIKGIADQTNLLALNAAIEAARAGEQGRGFAVVADEVRKLAEKTIKATDDISSKINSIQADSAMTTRSMAEASKEVTQATALMKNVGDSLNSIVSAVQKVRGQITHIATAVEEQSAASEEVATNIEKTSAIAKETEALSADVIREVDGLLRVAEVLRNNTEKFKTGDNLLILDLAKTDHRIFVDKVGAMLHGKVNLNENELADHRSCRFGKWYTSDGKELCGDLTHYRAIDGPHERVHSIARTAVAAFNSGDSARAEALFKEMEGTSIKIVEHLDGIKQECAARRQAASDMAKAV